jgi:hypothetical protein
MKIIASTSITIAAREASENNINNMGSPIEDSVSSTVS